MYAHALPAAEYGEYSLRDMLSAEVIFDTHRKQLAERVVEVVKHLHSCKLVHADIRPDHFYLVGSKWKLMDLSHARAVGEPLPPERGAQPMCYCAPEVAELVLRRADTASQAGSADALPLAVLAHESLDAWGVGLTLYELFASGGVPLFDSAKDVSHLSALAERRATISLGHVRPDAARHLLQKLLLLEPNECATLDEVAHHAWLAGGMDTLELEATFSGLQSRQEAVQRQLGRVQAGLKR